MAYQTFYFIQSPLNTYTVNCFDIKEITLDYFYNCMVYFNKFTIGFEKMQSNSIGGVHWGQQVKMFLHEVHCKCESTTSLGLSCVSFPPVLHWLF